MKKIPGPTSHARDATSELEAYLKIMDIDIIDELSNAPSTCRESGISFQENVSVRKLQVR